MRTRSSRISLYSCSTRRPRDCRPWSGDFDLTHLNYEVEVGSDRLEVQLDRYSSLYLEGLSGVEVVIGGRSKHVTSIDCRDLTLELGEAPIVGIYLLRSSGVDVQVGGQHPLGYFGLESCETTTLRARLEVGFTFTSYNSMGVTLNGARLLINPFDVGSWVWTGGNFHRRPGAGSRGGNLTLTLPYYEGNETVFGMEV